MTNRPDMIDEALMRPGRFDVKIEIGLPDEHGRVQILDIHTSKFKEMHIMGEIDVADLATRTKNFTGAELAGLCRSAASFALNRQVDAKMPTKAPDISKVKLEPADFEAALSEASFITLARWLQSLNCNNCKGCKGCNGFIGCNG
jgi:vesicle-fusing ATPase